MYASHQSKFLREQQIPDLLYRALSSFNYCSYFQVLTQKASAIQLYINACMYDLYPHTQRHTP